jgi:hypothetical protein
LSCHVAEQETVIASEAGGVIALDNRARIRSQEERNKMPLLRIDAASEGFADATAVTTISLIAVIVIDDSWLEAVLDNLALAKLSREEGIGLLRRLDDLERKLQDTQPVELNGKEQHPIVVGDHFADALNAYAMRAPDRMTPHNVLETIDLAARRFVADKHTVALRQLVFFISGNLEDVLEDEDGYEE